MNRKFAIKLKPPSSSLSTSLQQEVSILRTREVVYIENRNHETITAIEAYTKAPRYSDTRIPDTLSEKSKSRGGFVRASADVISVEIAGAVAVRAT